MTVTETPKGHNAYAFRERDNQARSPVTIAPLATGDASDRPTLVGPGEPVARIAGRRLFPDAS
jgi:amino acid/amide ABC transporter substrate-binding protein, HAAT family (TC 3.A.1.4.-)